MDFWARAAEVVSSARASSGNADGGLNNSPEPVQNPSSKPDEYLSDSMTSEHLSPKLIVEKPVIPALTLRLDNKDARILRWYDVTQENLDRVGIKTLDFVPDGLARLVDKNGNEICRAKIKLTEELDGLPPLLARIEKIWSLGLSPSEFWDNAYNLIIRARVPNFVEVYPDFHSPTRTLWLEFACLWIAFLAKLKCDSGQKEWSDLLAAPELIVKFVEFYNNSPLRGPDRSQPFYEVDRNHLQALLNAVRQARSNDQKKKTLESLAGALLKGIPGFEVFPNKWTATGEIDRWLRNSSSYPQLAMLKSPILVECKYWQKTVGTDVIGAFIVDIKDAGSTSGFLLCRKDISKSARRRIENFYQREKGYVVVITEKDVQKICDGSNLARMIVEKIESIIFQKR